MITYHIYTDDHPHMLHGVVDHFWVDYENYNAAKRLYNCLSQLTDTPAPRYKTEVMVYDEDIAMFESTMILHNVTFIRS